MADTGAEVSSYTLSVPLESKLLGPASQEMIGEMGDLSRGAITQRPPRRRNARSALVLAIATSVVSTMVVHP